MPTQCFTLALDRASWTTEATIVFQPLLEDCASQSAMELRFKQDLLTDDCWLKRRTSIHNWILPYFVCLAEVLQAVQAEDDGLICCNFNLGPKCDVGKILRQRDEWEWDEWQEERFRAWIDTSISLPPIQYLRTDTAMTRWHYRIPLRNQ